jgi:hypothetical protein
VLARLKGMFPSRDALLLKLGAAKQQSPSAWSFSFPACKNRKVCGNSSLDTTRSRHTLQCVNRFMNTSVLSLLVAGAPAE